MGKKAAPKKVITFCTTSVKTKRNEDDEKAAEEAQQAAAEEAEKERAAASAAAASEALSALRSGLDEAAAGDGDGLEDWERFNEETSPDAAQAKSAAGNDGEDVPMNTEEWEKAVESRLEEELSKLERRVIPADATSQLERRGGYPPAGVVVLNKVAEQKVEAALAALRDCDGHLTPNLPRHWRYKGKLTYERLNSIHSALEVLHFTGEQIRWAMGKTAGYDVRAPLEMLLLNLPKEELPRQFGGQSLGDDPIAAQAALDAEGDCLMNTSDLVEAPMGPAVLQPDPNEEAALEEEKQANRARARAEKGGGKGAAVAADSEESGSEEEGAAPESEAVEEKPAEPPKSEKEAARDFARRFASQYEEDDEDPDTFLNPEQIEERERKTDPTARYLKVVKHFEDASKTLKALKDKTRKGTFKQNTKKDSENQREAVAKMLACKAEVELLESGKYGPLDKELIAKSKPAPAPPPPPRPTPAEKEAAAEKKAADKKEAAAQEDDAILELPSLFDGDALTAAAAEAPAVKAVRSYGLASWTGKSPKQALDDFVKHKIWGKAAPKTPCCKYQKIPVAGGLFRSRVLVTLPRGRKRRFDPEESCETPKEAEHLASTLALMKLSEDADRPGLGRGLPPAYRQRWQEWEQEAKNRLKDTRRGLVKARVEFLERMMRVKKESLFVEKLVVADAGASKVMLGDGDDFGLQELSGDAAAKLRATFLTRQEQNQKVPEFDKMQQLRQHLPVAEYRDQFLRLAKTNGVVVVSGATGSGKTTQVPQYVLEEALEGSPDAPLPNIIVTEPRRISAVSVAKRVSQEMGDPSGGPGSKDSLVGYQIRLEKKVSSTCRLLFCTVGVLLKQMQQGAQAVLSKVTHIFIDEIHERSADCDLLLLLLRQIRHSRPDLRLVLMSATMESDKLTRYFGSNAPVLSFPGRTYPVEAFWLEDCLQMTGYRCEEDSDFAKKGWGRGYTEQKKTFQVAGDKGKAQTLTAYVDEEDERGFDDEAESCDMSRYNGETLRTLNMMDHTRINFDLIELILEYIEGSAQFAHVPRDEGAILVFLPGMMEITKVHERLRNSPCFGDPSTCLVLCLHSQLSGEDHAKVFDKPRRGVRKIVLSTNIAETGVTIGDVVFVVDAGKVKSQRYHEPSNTSSLKEQFVSKAEVLQRRGRAGRVQAGFGFTLMTKSRYDIRLQDMPTPEILRCSLMELMLSVLNSGLQPSCFSEALDPPPRSRIDQAVTTLKATGAVEEGVRPHNAPRWGGVEEDTWYVTTPVGQCLARLPCDIRLGKMVLYAALFGGVEAVWSVAATLSHRSPLATPFSDAKRAQAKATHVQELLPKDGAPSDHMALHTAYVKWDAAGRGADSFCKKNWLQNQVLQTIREIRKDLLDSLKNDGYCETLPKAEVSPQDVQSPHMVAAIIFAGLYPNVARVDPPKSASEKHPVLSAGSEVLKLHPSSLCHGKTEGLHRTNARWICYHTKMKTSQVFLRDVSFLPPNALLLFGGEASTLNIHPVEKSVSIGTGGEKHWHTVYVAPRTAAMVRQLRQAFDALLRRKASDPRQPLQATDRLVIAAYIAVINSVDYDG